MQSARSGWNLEKIISYEIVLHVYDPLKTGLYIPLTGRLKRRNSAINVKNMNDKCFYYCIYVKFLKDNDPKVYQTFPTRLYRKCRIQFNFNNVKYPASLKDIDIFKKNN